MRAALLPVWPALSKHYGLHPWDVDRLSAAEMNQYLDGLAELARG